ncbi:MAG: NADH-quinone oxidoreductase subunit J [Leadbetterella sp.]|nr:NADH-quinone oxidoreductase subunit J [Leadbetterella sp.]
MEILKNIGMVEWVYYFFAALAISGALGTILSKKPMHSVISLIVTFFSLSGIYVLLNAQFLAVVNIIVYAGAIMVLFLFVIMFLNLRQESNELGNTPMVIASTVSGLLLALMLVVIFRKAYIEPLNPALFSNETGMIERLGNLLYTHYMLPFELVSVLFLVAISGAILIGKREKGGRHF